LEQEDLILQRRKAAVDEEERRLKTRELELEAEEREVAIRKGEIAAKKERVVMPDDAMRLGQTLDPRSEGLDTALPMRIALPLQAPLASSLPRDLSPAELRLDVKKSRNASRP